MTPTTAKPVFFGPVDPTPAGKTATRRGALNIARRYLGPIERMLLANGFKLRVHETPDRFRVRLAK